MYADLLFLTEFMNDCLVLSIVKAMTGYHTTKKRLLAGSLTGAFISTLLAIVFPDAPIIFNIAAGIILCLAMIWICFNPKIRSSFFRLFLHTYAAAFILGGVISFIEQYIPSLPVPIIFIMGFILLKTGLLIASYINKKGGKLCRVNIKFQDEVLSYTALIDTGNLLIDNESKLPVSVIAAESVPKSCITKPTHTITFNSLGCTNGALEIIYAPYICVEYKGEKKLIEKAPLGLAGHKLSASDSYQMIISPEIINKMEI